MPALAQRYPTNYPHISRDEQGRWWIEDTGMRLTMLLEWIFGDNRFTPEQMVVQFPQLSLAQIHAGLLFYYDHREAVDAAMAREQEEYHRLRSATENPEWQAELCRRVDSLGRS